MFFSDEYPHHSDQYATKSIIEQCLLQPVYALGPNPGKKDVGTLAVNFSVNFRLEHACLSNKTHVEVLGQHQSIITQEEELVWMTTTMTVTRTAPMCTRA